MDKLKQNFRDLSDSAINIKEKNMNLKPVFEEVPKALKDFATKVASNVSHLKSKLTFEFLDGAPDLRSKGLKGNNSENIVTITNWIVSALKHIIDKVEQQGEIITVHTEALAKPETALLVAKDEEIKKLKTEIGDLNNEIDETRQRGIKGNLIISSPQNDKQETIAKKQMVGGQLESDTKMVIRLIKEKTGVVVDEKDVIACHPIGKKENHAYVIRLGDRKDGSAWNILTEGMRTGKNSATQENFNKQVHLYINYQLTQKRAKLAMAVRKARTDQKIIKYYINQNGEIKVKKNEAQGYTKVTSEDHLNSIINS